MPRPPLVEPAAALTPAERERYGRHVLLPELGETGQRRLKNARVLVVGAGGLGSPVLLYLAAAGVGRLGIVEFDRVEESNLQRQVIHGQSDVGRSKARSARDAVLEVNPLVDVRLHEQRLDASNALAIAAGYDLLVDGSDNFPTRYLVNDTAVLLGKPYVWGSVLRFDGQAGVVWPGQGACYRCLHPTPPPPGSVPSCAEGGVLGVLCASIGAVQATEAVKVITGIGEPLVGRVTTYDALRAEHRPLAVRRDPGCAVCGDAPTVTAPIDYDAFCGLAPPPPPAAGIDVDRLRELLAGPEPVYLVDVREPAEHAAASIPGAVLIPRGEFLAGDAVGRLPRDRRIVLHCASGVRSAEVLALVRAAGFTDAVHLAGGIRAWQA